MKNRETDEEMCAYRSPAPHAQAQTVVVAGNVVMEVVAATAVRPMAVGEWQQAPRAVAVMQPLRAQR